MRKFIINIFLAGAILMTLPSAWGFSLAEKIGFGGDSWQTVTIGYGWIEAHLSDAVAPADIYQEYRPVVPVMIYACDGTFLTYFGATGQTNIDEAFGILNGYMCGLTNTPVFLYSETNGVTLPGNGLPGGVPVTLTATNTVDRYSADLSEFPMENNQVNYTAQTMDLLDIKSEGLGDMVLQLGLADPTRYVWTLHDRYLPANGVCPQNEEYLVVQRNYDVNPTQNYPYSSYINGSLYYYQIDENCGATGLPFDAITYSQPVDTDASFLPMTAGGLYGNGLYAGGYYTGLERDTAAGLKYLLSTNIISWESTASSGGTLFTTNVGGQIPLFTSDLGKLIASSQTNDPVTLATLFPGLTATGVATNYALGYITNVVSYYTNLIGSPYGSPPQLVTLTNLTPTILTNYLNVFNNVVTNHYYPDTYTRVMTTAVTNLIGAPYGSPLVTYVTYKSVVLTNVPSGDYYLIASNLLGYKINSVILTNQIIVTNLFTGATNTVSTTTTNTASTNGYSFSQQILTYTTNYWLLVQPLSLSSASNTPALRYGIGRIQFIRANYDSLLGQLFVPVTNNYSMVKVVNSQPVVEYYQRVVTAPDFLFQSADLATLPVDPIATVTSPQFDTSAVPTGQAGPGAIIPGGTVIVFNNNGTNVYRNAHGLGGAGYLSGTNSFLNYNSQESSFGWGAFDGSTNFPVAFPSSASIAGLMNQLVMAVTPATAPDGTNGVPYSVTFGVSGGTPPYAWAAPGFAVPGLSFDPATQTVSGTPTVSASFNFTLQVTDSANRVVSLNYPITIH